MSRLTGQNQRRATIKDIASLANVSIGTVDRVLHNRGEVNPDTRNRVMSFIEELGYTPNLIAKSLALKKSFKIAALIPGAGESNPYWTKPLEGINKAAAELKDYNAEIVVSNFDAGEEGSFIRQFERILSGNPSGVILAPQFYEASLHYTNLCKEKGIPVVFIDTDLEGAPGLSYFGQDALQSGYVAARLMHYGLPECSKVLILNLARNKLITRHMQLREQGFMNYFKEVVPDHCIRALPVEIDLSQAQEPGASMHEILSHETDISGIFVTNSRVHKVARYLSGMPGRHRLLVGYDLIEANLEFMENGIIDFLICQKPEEQGYKSAMAMYDYLLTGTAIGKVNHSPIDIVVKENSGYYRNIINLSNT
ncbi:MAG TPA: substrate-binding domain-containing protein [Bacteroidales bacterium]|nr:substrate-binding domain-containing protein [Bacteroidales bacterium]